MATTINKKSSLGETTHKCINANFFDVKDLPKCDMVLTDTPYGTTKAKWDSIIDLSSMWDWLSHIRKSTTPVLLFSQLPYDKVLGASNINGLKYEWIWEKASATGHLNAKKMPMKAHENILVFYNKLPLYNYEKTQGHIRKTALKTIDSSNRCELYGNNTQDVNYDSTSRYPRTVLKYPSDKQKLSINPTQKPINLLRYFIRTYTNVGDTVIDFTAGSFSLAIACYLEGRNSIVIEKDIEQYKKSIRWLENSNENDIFNY